ncbi:MAG: hypothetical protein Q7L55_11775 [Actinomycetota bacterium]|nr:hypothetical protein [Actinomycetota bacterium]
MSHRKSSLASVVTAIVVAFLSIVFVADGAHAAEAEGCSGNATSYTASGGPLDLAYAPGIGGTEERPFVIDMEGKVQWEGASKVVLKNGAYKVTVSGFPVSSGDFTNDEGLKKSQGEYALSDLPGAVTFMLNSLGEAKVPVTATVTGSGGSCTASGYITGSGSPFASPLFYSGLIFLLIFFLMFLGILLL